MRPMSEMLAVRASNNGILQFSIRTDSVTVDTQWTDCTNPKMGEHLPALLLTRDRGLP